MAYRRSISSSDDDSVLGPKWTAPSSDSSDSHQSGSSAKYEWIWDCTRRRERLPQTPSPVELFEDDQENIHPAEVQWGEQESEDEESADDSPVVHEVSSQEYSDSELQEVVQKFQAQSSYTGPPGFGAGSSAAAALQQHLNVANICIDELEGQLQDRDAGFEAVEFMNSEPAERVAELSVGYVMRGNPVDAPDGVYVAPQTDVAVLVELVVLVALVVRLLVMIWW